MIYYYLQQSNYITETEFFSSSPSKQKQMKDHFSSLILLPTLLLSKFITKGSDFS